MLLGKRVWTAGKFFVLLGAVVGTFCLFAVASMRLALRAREVQVPDLVNRSANEATVLAANLGLSIKVDDARRPDADMAPGRVLGQEPPAGTLLRRQRSVRVWLSAGVRAPNPPPVIGETERSAQLRLGDAGFALAGISEIRSDSQAPDVVIGQDPAPTAAGDRVTLLVNRPENSSGYVMPDIIGVSGDRATSVLRNQGFRVAVVASAPYPGVPAGVVLRQNPQAGFQLTPGEPISVEVSQ
jgi:beta-lactam-binding protein with PASTA domain